MSDVRVLNILGRGYSIRAVAEEQDTLVRAEQLLQARIRENQQRFPQADTQELLVMAALSLCAPLIQQEQQQAQTQARLETLLSSIHAQRARG